MATPSSHGAALSRPYCAARWARASPLPAPVTPADFYFTEWHSWVSYHGNAEIFSYQGDSKFEVEDDDFTSLFETLNQNGYKVEPETKYTYTLLPMCSKKGFTAAVNGNRLSFIIFHDECDAGDYAAYTPHATKAGRAAVLADPVDADKFLDARFAERKDEADIPYSPLVNDAAFL